MNVRNDGNQWMMLAFVGSIVISLISLILFLFFQIPFLLLGLFLPFPLLFRRKEVVIEDEMLGKDYLESTPSYCPRCGTPRIGQYCYNCGYKFF